MKKRILFVDDNDMLLKSTKRFFHSMDKEWDLCFADSGAKALALMLEKPFDLVISDMLMPGMTGAELFEEVRQLYPATIRFILSGQAPDEEISKSIASPDHFFLKPLNLVELRTAVRQATAGGAVTGQADTKPSIE